MSSGVLRRFNRYELKYLIHASQVKDITTDLLHQMAPDRHGDASGSYIITNLYYDSADLHMLRSKLIGSNYRRKLRIRVYGETPNDLAGKAMVEIKQRLGRTTQKRRVVLPLREAYSLCDGESAWNFDDPADVQVVDEVEALVHALQLRPVCTISYRRRAYVGSRFEPGLRVTFDTDLWGAPPTMDLPVSGPSNYLIPRDWSILEIKVDEKVPGWICDLVTKHNCQLRRVSKYCLGMIHLHALQLPMGAWSYSHDLSDVLLQATPAVTGEKKS
jgi:SPX domain protein involved in polyphosphate accumulation